MSNNHKNSDTLENWVRAIFISVIVGAIYGASSTLFIEHGISWK